MTLFQKELSELSDEARKIQLAYEDSDDTKFKVDDITYTYVDYICEPAIARGITKIANAIRWKVDRLKGITFHYDSSCGVTAILSRPNHHNSRVLILSAEEFDLFGKSFGEAALMVAAIMQDAESLIYKGKAAAIENANAIRREYGLEPITLSDVFGA